MLSELWGFYPRLQEKLICKDEKQAKQGGEKRVVVMLRCRFMVRNMQPPPTQSSPGTLPISSFVSSSIWTSATHPKNPPSLHPPQILPCLSHLALLPPGWIQNPGAGAVEGSTLPYFQETFQTYMPGCVIWSASNRLLGHPFTRTSLVAAQPETEL